MIYSDNTKTTVLGKTIAICRRATPYTTHSKRPTDKRTYVDNDRSRVRWVREILAICGIKESVVKSPASSPTITISFNRESPLSLINPDRQYDYHPFFLICFPPISKKFTLFS